MASTPATVHFDPYRGSVKLPPEDPIFDVLGASRVLGLGSALLSIVRSSLQEAHVGLNNTQDSLSLGLGWFVILRLANDCAEYAKWARKTTLEKCILISSTLADCFSSMKFLDGIQISRFASIFGTIGNIPVFGAALSVFNLVYHSSSFYKHAIAIHNARISKQVADGSVEGLANRIAQNEQVIGLSRQDSKEYLNTQHSQSLKEKEIAVLKLKHNSLSLVYYGASVILAALVAIGIFAGITALAATGWGVIVLGVVAASLGVAKHFYSKRQERNILILEAAKNRFEMLKHDYERKIEVVWQSATPSNPVEIDGITYV